MSAEKLKHRLEKFNKDFERIRGSVPNHFVCPIRLSDEPGEIIKGHVISQTLRNCSRVWVPQRGDVDGVFGSVEAEYQKNFVARADTGDLFSNKKTFKQIRPTLELNGREIKYRVIPIGPASPPRKDCSEVEIVALVDKNIAGDKEYLDVDSVVDRNDRGVAFMSVLHAAHLTMFYLLGYWYTFSFSAKRLRNILDEFSTRGMELGRVKRLELAEEFRSEHQWMHVPLGGPFANEFKGTVEDKKFLVLFDKTGQEYAWGIIVRFGDDRIVVFQNSDPQQSHLFDKHMAGEFRKLYVKPARLVCDHLQIKDVEIAAGKAIEMPIFN